MRLLGFHLLLGAIAGVIWMLDRIGLRRTAKKLQKKAEQGDAAAQYKLAGCYGKGKGVPQDYVRSYAWHHLAETQGVAEAAEVIPLLMQRMTSAQIEEGRQLSEEYAKKFIKKQAHVRVPDEELR